MYLVAHKELISAHASQSYFSNLEMQVMTVTCPRHNSTRSDGILSVPAACHAQVPNEDRYSSKRNVEDAVLRHANLSSIRQVTDGMSCSYALNMGSYAQTR